VAMGKPSVYHETLDLTFINKGRLQLINEEKGRLGGLVIIKLKVRKRIRSSNRTKTPIRFMGILVLREMFFDVGKLCIRS
jgi:hypothetical protein